MEETLFPATGKREEFGVSYQHCISPSTTTFIRTYGERREKKRPYKQISLKNIIDETYQLRNIKPLHPIKKSVQ